MPQIVFVIWTSSENNPYKKNKPTDFTTVILNSSYFNSGHYFQTSTNNSFNKTMIKYEKSTITNVLSKKNYRGGICFFFLFSFSYKAIL